MAQESSLSRTSRGVKKIIIGFVVFSVLLMSYNWIRPMFDSLGQGGEGDYSPYLKEAKVFKEINPPPVEPLYTLSAQSDPKFSLEGFFGNFPTVVYIYEISKPIEKFDTGSNAERTAVSLGFEELFQNGPDNTIFWGSKSTKYLEFNRTTLKFKLESNNYQKAPVPDLEYDEDNISNIVDHFSLLNLATFNYDFAKYSMKPVKKSQTSHSGFEITDKSYQFLISIPASVEAVPINNNDNSAYQFLSEKKITRDFDIITENPYISNFYSVVNEVIFKSESGFEENIVYLSYTPTEIINVKEEGAMQTKKVGVYPIISVSKAYELLQKGDGYLRVLTRTNTDHLLPPSTERVNDFRIRAESVKLAYYQPSNWSENTKYLFPVYVFSGEAVFADGKSGEFIFYVHAL